MIWTDQQISELAEECLNDLCKKVQDRIGQTDGGYAGLYHSDEQMVGFIEEYIRYEMEHAKTATEEGFRKFVETRTFCPDVSKVPELQEDGNDPALIYDGCYCILIWKGEYLLVIENNQYISKDLEALERRLYEWQTKA
jgi:hypothetical protein